MKLFLVQHAKAVSKELDPDRPLSEEGCEELQKICDFIRSLNLSVDFVWHSGKKRAQETVEMLVEAMSVGSQEIRNNLGPNDDVTEIADEIGKSKHNTMIVGHLPFLSKLVSLLLSGSDTTDIVGFRNAGIVCLSDNKENKWEIEWILTPQIVP